LFPLLLHKIQPYAGLRRAVRGIIEAAHLSIERRSLPELLLVSIRGTAARTIACQELCGSPRGTGPTSYILSAAVRRTEVFFQVNSKGSFLFFIF
jgi:hypothetical protein